MTADPALSVKLARANRRRRLASAVLVAPLFVFLCAAFLVPLGSILFQSVENTDVSRFMPRTAEAVAGWSGEGVPDEPVFAALAADLAEGYEAKTIARAATSLNHQQSGFRSLVMRSARRADRLEAPYRAALTELNPDWAETRTWTVIARAARPITDRYLLAAVDLERNADGEIVQAPENRRIYVDYLLRTVWISLTVTVLCLLLGFPMAQLIASATGGWRRALFILVLLPFWTSLLVRTAAWVILLQRSGAVNATLMELGLIDAPLELIFNRFGVYVAMTHVLLPFMILPIYSVMRGIPSDHLRASASLGARPLGDVPVGLSAADPAGRRGGCLLVWVLAIGFYITPALVGGGGDQMLSFLIAEFTLRTANWHMAAALAILLLLMVGLLYPIIMRLTGANRVETGR
jgi:putative spermidine/putrescine transport system permease protein